MTKYNVGIIGNGFVGQALAYGFSPVAKIRIYDLDPLKCVDEFKETVNRSDILFVSVPTPMNPDGSINLDIINDVITKIDDANIRKDNVVVLKSTVVPGTTDFLKEKFPSLNFVYNPEFLTERKAKFDFLNQSRVVLGGDFRSVQKVVGLYINRFNHCNFVKTDPRTAEFIKYLGNVFFALKVSFANETRLFAEEIGVNWDDALRGFVADGRVADSHLHVPGPDGKLGFGGSCLPKDLNAFIALADSVGISLNTLKAAWQTNLEIRPEKDWEKLKGRAVIKEN
jgi:UDPglucose 6-dehydrogenase